MWIMGFFLSIEVKLVSVLIPRSGQDYSMELIANLTYTITDCQRNAGG